MIAFLLSADSRFRSTDFLKLKQIVKINSQPATKKKEDPMKKIALGILVLSLLFVSSAFATVNTSAATLSGTLTVDDAFKMFISTDDYKRGTLILSQSNGANDEWKTPLTFSTLLASPGTYYLHIKARDVRQVIAGFLGDFTLTGSATFSNGTQSLLTNTTDWTVRKTGWNHSFATVTSSGTNDSAEPWFSANGGSLSGIDAAAEWIWTNNGDFHNSPRYFSTKITVTPEPVSAGLFLLGAGVLGLTKLRRKKK